MSELDADLSSRLQQLFDAERLARQIHGSLVDSDVDALLPMLRAAVEATRDLADEEEVALRLVKVASVLGELEGVPTVELLLDILGNDDPEVRRAAGEALEELAFDRFKEVAIGVEKALERLPAGNPALAELPYLLAQVGESGVLKLLQRFLEHPDPYAVAATIEVIADSFDAAAATMLTPLENDTRTVMIEDDHEGEGGQVTLSELVKEARQILNSKR